MSTYDEALPVADLELSAKTAFNTGNALFRQGDMEHAIESYKQALRLDPHDRDAKHNLELALAQLREEQNAQEPEQQQGDPSQESEQQQQGGQQDQQQQGSQEPEAETGPGDDQQQPGDEQQQSQDDADEQGDPSEQGDQTSGGDQQSQPAPVPPTGLTEEQARQLVEAVGNNAESLQSQMQYDTMFYTTPPEQDW